MLIGSNDQGNNISMVTNQQSVKKEGVEAQNSKDEVVSISKNEWAGVLSQLADLKAKVDQEKTGTDSTANVGNIKTDETKTDTTTKFTRTLSDMAKDVLTGKGTCVYTGEDFLDTERNKLKSGLSNILTVLKKSSEPASKDLKLMEQIANDALRTSDGPLMGIMGIHQAALEVIKSFEPGNLLETIHNANENLIQGAKWQPAAGTGSALAYYNTLKNEYLLNKGHEFIELIAKEI